MSASTNSTEICPGCMVKRERLSAGGWCKTCGWRADRERKPENAETFAPLEHVWLLRMEQKQGGPNEPRRAVEGVALHEEDARMWEAESGEYRNTAEQVPVWRQAMMMVSGDVDLDDPEMAEAMEDIRQAGAKRLAREEEP